MPKSLAVPRAISEYPEKSQYICTAKKKASAVAFPALRDAPLTARGGCPELHPQTGSRRAEAAGKMKIKIKIKIKKEVWRLRKASYIGIEERDRE